MLPETRAANLKLNADKPILATTAWSLIQVDSMRFLANFAPLFRSLAHKGCAFAKQCIVGRLVQVILGRGGIVTNVKPRQ